MDKISSIISSSRNQVDMSKERPVRAGAPSYGQPVSSATQTFQKAQREENLMFPSAQLQAENAKLNNPETLRHSGIIDKITFSFKGNSEKPNESETVEFSPQELVSHLENAEKSESGSEPQSVDIYA